LAIGGPILIFLGSLVTAVGTVGTAFKALKLITISLGMAMRLTLIGVVITALVIVITHFKQFKVLVSDVFTAIKHVAMDFGHALGKIFSAIGDAITWPFRKAFQFIKAGFHAVTSLPSGLIHGVGGLLHAATFGLMSGGGPVRTHFDAGGPVGSDTIPGWLTPGEFVLNRATTARVGMPTLQRMNAGGDAGGNVNVTITPMPVNIDGRTVAQAVLKATLNKSARGASTLTGGGLMTGTG
jgi:hypothetical protein